MPSVSRVLPTLLAALLFTAAAASDASAITAELAKKCRELAVQAHPPAVAGSRQGTAQIERDFFQKCVANNGNMDAPATAPAPAPDPATAPPPAAR